MPTATRTAPKTRARNNGTSDVLALLKRDHTEVKGLFDQIQGLGDRAVAQRRKLGEKICAALETHSKFEEQTLYPQVRERAEDREDREQVLEAFEEHGIADRLVGDLKGMDATDERYEPKMQVLSEAIRHHIREEEGKLFPIVRDLFEKEELDEMGEQLVDAKARAGLE